MAKCTGCGKDAGFMSSKCDACLELDRQRWAAEAREASGGEDEADVRRREPGFAQAADRVQLTTTSTLPGRRITEVVEVLTAESALRNNQLADLFSTRLEGTQATLRQVRRFCLKQLREEAAAVGADAVVAVRLDYSSLGAQNNLLFVVASGTAVRTVPETDDGLSGATVSHPIAGE